MYCAQTVTGVIGEVASRSITRNHGDAMTDSTVRVAVIGGGAIGGLAASAARAAGHDVTLCVRTPIRRLEIETDGSRREVPVRVATDPEALSPVPWVLLATKAQDTAGAAGWLARLTSAETVVAVLQNGIEHEARVRPLIGAAAVVPVLVYAAVERVTPGHIVRHTGNRFVVPQTAHGAALAQLLAGSGLDVTQEPDFTTAAWRKLLSNVAANPITALTLRRIGVMREPAIQALARGLLTEAAAVGRAAGARLTGDDIDSVLAAYTTLAESGGSSMLYDRLAGNPLEHQYLTGAVVRTAERYGVPVPLNKAVLALLDAMDKGLQSEPAAATSRSQH